MASRLKWPLGIVLACLAVWAWAWHVDIPVPGFGGHGMSQARVRKAELGRELARATSSLEQLAVVDSLLPLVPDTPGVRVLLPDWIEPSNRDEIRAIVDSTAWAGPRRARVGVFAVDGRIGRGAHAPSATARREQFYAGTTERGPYCMLVAVIGRAPDSDSLRYELGTNVRAARRGATSQPLGPCGYWLRYGQPGPTIGAWLDAGGYAFATEASPAEPAAPPASRRGVFGVRPPSEWLSGSARGEACLGGRPAACARAVLRPAEGEASYFAPRPAPGPMATERSSFRPATPFGEGGQALLADLEREFGADRFASFWRSDAPPSEAFEAAFGRPLGEWVLDWAQARLGTEPRGPRLDLKTLALALLTLGALVGVAIAIGERRRVG